VFFEVLYQEGFSNVPTRISRSKNSLSKQHLLSPKAAVVLARAGLASGPACGDWVPGGGW